MELKMLPREKKERLTQQSKDWMKEQSLEGHFQEIQDSNSWLSSNLKLSIARDTEQLETIMDGELDAWILLLILLLCFFREVTYSNIAKIIPCIISKVYEYKVKY